jgi:ABC-type multidrug transport system fused ATPase/permease subunit
MDQIVNVGFWLGLLLALPIGIVTNLLTPRVQARLEKRSERVAADRARERLEQRALVERYRGDQAAYWSYLYLSLTRILWRVAMLLAAAIVPYLVGEWLWSYSDGLAVFLFNTCVLIWSVGTLAALLNDIRRTRSVVSAIAEPGEDGTHAESSPQR